VSSILQARWTQGNNAVRQFRLHKLNIAKLRGMAFARAPGGRSAAATARRSFRSGIRRWADYWRQQAYPVMLVIRSSDGAIRWMDVSASLERAGSRGTPLRQVVFEGERFDALSVREWRKRVLGPRG
jgi:hypothetical protein